MKKLKLTSLALLCVLFSCSQNASSSLKDKESQETSYSTSEQQESINSQTTNETSTLNQTSSSENSSSSSFQSSFEGINTPYETKMNAYFDGATIQDTNFVNKVKTLGEYDSSKEVTNNVIYASPDGNGDGSFNSPYELQEAFDNLKPGMTLYLKGGTYDRKNGDGYFINCQGREDAYVSIRPYKDEKVIITNSSRGKESYGFQVDGNSCYFILENIEIKDIKGNSACGIAFWGNNQNHIIIRNCEVHHIETTSTNPEKDTNAGANAILLFGEQSKAINNVALINNYCHDNINGWSENISVSGNCEYIYVLENRVENNTNIGTEMLVIVQQKN